MMVNKEKKRVNAPKKRISPQTFRIDATDKVLGRLASEVAVLLRGKNKVTFQPYLNGGNEVIINNASKIKITGRKLEQKKYYHYSGYPGGLKEKKLADLFKKNQAMVLEKAIWNMLPKNKLRAKMIKRLKITN